jgi:Ca2+-binding EF-hand superfamily protein
MGDDAAVAYTKSGAEAPSPLGARGSTGAHASEDVVRGRSPADDGRKGRAAAYEPGMKWCVTIVLVLGYGSAVVPQASAEPPARSAAPAREDADGDGVVTLDEARSAGLGLFERFDRDRDGVVTRVEARATRAPLSRDRFEVRFVDLDRDRDGRLSPWESRLPPRRFARVDRDADGRLSRAELWRAAERSRRSGHTDALSPLFWRRDLDGDGRVTRAEARLAAEQRFRRRDRDGDGRLTARDAGSGRR